MCRPIAKRKERGRWAAGTAPPLSLETEVEMHTFVNGGKGEFLKGGTGEQNSVDFCAHKE